MKDDNAIRKVLVLIFTVMFQWWLFVYSRVKREMDSLNTSITPCVVTSDEDGSVSGISAVNDEDNGCRPPVSLRSFPSRQRNYAMRRRTRFSTDNVVLRNVTVSFKTDDILANIDWGQFHDRHLWVNFSKIFIEFSFLSSTSKKYFD